MSTSGNSLKFAGKWTTTVADAVVRAGSKLDPGVLPYVSTKRIGAKTSGG
jgi:hypothetical protein